MGLKLYLIIITNAANTNLAELPAKLDINGPPRQTITLAAAQRGDSPSIGKYEDKILIVSLEELKEIEEDYPDKNVRARYMTMEYGVRTVKILIDKYLKQDTAGDQDLFDQIKMVTYKN